MRGIVPYTQAAMERAMSDFAGETAFGGANRAIEIESRRERGRIAARGVLPWSYHAAGPSGCDDAQHGPRPVHGEWRTWPGRASPSKRLGLAGLIRHQREPEASPTLGLRSGNIANRSFLSRSRRGFESLSPCVWSKNN